MYYVCYVAKLSSLFSSHGIEAYHEELETLQLEGLYMLYLLTIKWYQKCVTPTGSLCSEIFLSPINPPILTFWIRKIHPVPCDGGLWKDCDGFSNTKTRLFDSWLVLILDETAILYVLNLFCICRVCPHPEACHKDLCCFLDDLSGIWTLGSEINIYQIDHVSICTCTYIYC